MNERIKQLKQQAGIDDNPDQEGLDLFAELIVDECTRCMAEADIQLGESFDKTMVPWLLQDISLQIQQHFGIKE